MQLTALADRQLGLRPTFYYDNILRRLIVKKCDSFLGICPNEERLDYNPYPPLFACRFAEKYGFEHILALANEDGRVAIQNTLVSIKNVEEPAAFNGFQCHANAVFDLVWKPGFMSFVTVSGDHSAKLWDIHESTVTNVLDFQGHNRSVRTAAFQPDDPSIFATGARDGKILIWDTRVHGSVNTIKPTNSIHNCHPIQMPKTPGSGSKKFSKPIDRTNSVTGLVFQNNSTLISCGSGDGSIRVWDLRRNYSNFKKDPLPKHSIPYCGSSSKNGYSNLLLDKARLKLFASCVDNVIYCFNISTYNTSPEQKYIGHENGSFYIKSSLSPDSKYLISGSSDRDAYIWNLKYGEPIIKLCGHLAEVTCATWCQTGDLKIVTCSDDARHKVWRIGNEFLTEKECLGLYGRAHDCPPIERSNRSNWESLDRTPKPPKRKMSDDEGGSSTKRISLQTFDESEATSSRTNTNTSMQRRRSKRSLIDMMNDSLVLPDMNDENEGSCPKRRLMDSGMKIINDDGSGPSTSHKNLLHGNLAPIPEDSVLMSSDDFPIMSRNLRSEDFITPTKSTTIMNKSPCLYYYSPNRVLNSPTMNLPNFVSDGKAPHLPPEIPQKKNGNIDWLTKMRQVITNPTQPDKIVNKIEADEGSTVSEKPKQEKTILQFFTRTTMAKKTGDTTPLLDKTNKIHPRVKRKSTDVCEFETKNKIPHRPSPAVDSSSLPSTSNSNDESANKTRKPKSVSKNIRSFFISNVENKK